VAVQPDADATAELADRAARGELTLRVAETLPLEHFRDAYALLERGGLHGRSCSRPERRRARLSSPWARQPMLAQVAHQARASRRLVVLCPVTVRDRTHRFGLLRRGRLRADSDARQTSAHRAASAPKAC
jgi:hypothetical protein